MNRFTCFMATTLPFFIAALAESAWHTPLMLNVLLTLCILLAYITGLIRGELRNV